MSLFSKQKSREFPALYRWYFVYTYQTGNELYSVAASDVRGARTLDALKDYVNLAPHGRWIELDGQLVISHCTQLQQ